MNYRGKLDIIADILTVASQNAKRTQIMYQANLSYKVMMRYLDEVVAALCCPLSMNSSVMFLWRRAKSFGQHTKNTPRPAKASKNV